jgi:AAA domain-containing protein/Toprim domain-containing protein
MTTDKYARHMAGVAQLLLGAPNKNSTKTTLRYGTKGSLSIDARKGTFMDFGANVGGGVLDLIHHIEGLDPAGCHDWLRRNDFDIGDDSPRTNGATKPNGRANGHAKSEPFAPKEDDAAHKLAMAQKIAAKSVPIKGTPAEAYVKARGISIGSLAPEALKDLLFCPAEGKYHAAMVAVVRDIATGKPTGSIHRTFINTDGSRLLDDAGKPMTKMGLGAHGEHGMVLIGDMPQEGPLLIGEGIEDALTGAAIMSLPAVATLGIGRLKSVKLPPGVEPVLLAQKKKIADQEGWIAAAKHYAAQGHDVEIAWPGAHGDFNDLLQKDGQAAVEAVISEAETIAAKQPDGRPDGQHTQQLEVWDGDDDGWIAPREFLLGTTFCRQFTSMLQSPGGIGKTSVRIAQAIAVASGQPITGEHVFQRCRVLLICLEDDINELRRRIRACRRHHKIVDSLKGWLSYCAPGRRSGKLMTGEGQTRKPGELAEHIVNEIKNRKPDVVIIDPLKKAHGVNENNNSDMDEVMDLVTAMAVEHNIAIDLPHHTAKGTPEAGNAEKGRGASATKDAARLVKTLTLMTPEEASAFGLKDDRRRYVRYDYAKENIAPASETKWFKLVSVPLGNATELYPNGDNVQAIEMWTPPDAWKGMGSSLTKQILDAIDAGLPNGERYSDASKATARAAWQVVRQFTGKDEGPSRQIIKTWVKNGVLIRENYTSPTRREPQIGLVVDPTKRPSE